MAENEKASPENDRSVGASDGNSGGGAARGIPDGETGMRTGDPAKGHDVEKDRKTLFGGAESKSTPAAQSEYK